jgi:hypothetical protein
MTIYVTEITFWEMFENEVFFFSFLQKKKYPVSREMLW